MPNGIEALWQRSPGSPVPRANRPGAPAGAPAGISSEKLEFLLRNLNFFGEIRISSEKSEFLRKNRISSKNMGIYSENIDFFGKYGFQKIFIEICKINIHKIKTFRRIKIASKKKFDALYKMLISVSSEILI